MELRVSLSICSFFPLGSSLGPGIHIRVIFWFEFVLDHLLSSLDHAIDFFSFNGLSDESYPLDEVFFPVKFLIMAGPCLRICYGW